MLCLVIGEIFLFIQIGGQIGALMTILLVFTTAFFFLSLMRRQGFAAFTQAYADLARGAPPFIALGEGVLILLAGLLLLVPGFLTDAIGFLLLIPPIRQFMAEFVIGGIIPVDIFSELLKNRPKQQGFEEQENVYSESHFDIDNENKPKPDPQMRENGDIIDTDFNVEDERNSR